MSLISRLLHEVSEEEKRTGESQCFIGHEFRHKDLRVKLERALDRLDLQAYFADKEVTGEFILIKVCKKILGTRASIVDLTTANPNVYFELGVTIGLNKPVFVVLKRGASVPPLLESFVKLRFTHYAGLERELVEQVPGWLEQSIEHHLLYNTHCHFVNVLCPDRQRITPQRRYLVIDQIEGTDEAGQPILTHDPDLRAELPVALDRFHFDPVFLGDMSLQDTFRLCDYCRTLRDSSFALCHLSQRTSPNVHLLLGLVTGLDIPSLLMVHEERRKDGQPLFQVPTMLRGLDAFYYEHAVDIAERLGDEVEGFLNRQRSKPITERKLAFPDLTRRFVFEEPIEGELGLTASSPAEFSELLNELTSSNVDLEELLVRVIDKAIEAVEGAESDTLYCTILLFDTSEEKLLTVAARGYPRGSIESVVGKSFEMSEGVVGFVARARRSMRVDDVGTESRYLELLPDVRSELAVPLIDTDRQLIGVINLESPQVAYFREEHARSIEVLAGAAAVAIQKAARRTRPTTVRETLGRVQSITDPSQQATAMVALLDELAEIRDTEGIRSVVEIALTITVTEAQARVLQAASRAYENLGESEKARQVADLIPLTADDGFAHDVFISYSHHDRDWVLDWLVPGLTEAGLRVCIDQENFRPGEPLIAEIQRAIESSRIMLPVLTPEYLAGDWSSFADMLALSLIPSTRGRRIIPVLLRQTELPPPLRDLMLADFTQPAMADTVLGQLVAAIRGGELRREYEPTPNPFRVGAPVSGELFFDREEELQRVLLSVERDQNISIVGPRRIGKTSLLQTVFQRLRSRENYVCLYIDLQALWSEEEFYRYLGRELETVGVQHPDSDDQEWSGLALREVLQNIAPERKVVLLMDEFEVAARGYTDGKFSDQFFGVLRSLGQSGLITMVVASARGLFELSVGSQYASPFANIFSVIHLGPFGRDDARRLATLAGTVDFSAEEIDFIVDTTGGHPFYIQMLCSLLIDTKNASQGHADLQLVREDFLKKIKPFREFESEE